MCKVTIKTEQELAVMAEGGRILGEIREAAARSIVPGITTVEIDRVADDLIKQSGGQASFKMVSGYKHATCVNINDVVVHGIPGKEIVKEGDVVGVDVGLYYKGYHTDTATTVIAGNPANKKQLNEFLDIGRVALKKAINQARPGRRVSDISRAMQTEVEAGGWNVVRALTGHGIGKELHEEPFIPCFVVEDHNSLRLEPGIVIAIEVMYNAGTFEVAYKNSDGWTIATADGKMSGLFEETVAITANDPIVLTKYK